MRCGKEQVGETRGGRKARREEGKKRRVSPWIGFSVSRRPRSRRKDGGMRGARLVETSVETSSGEGVDSRKNLDAVRGGEVGLQLRVMGLYCCATAVTRGAFATSCNLVSVFFLATPPLLSPFHLFPPSASSRFSSFQSPRRIFSSLPSFN